MQITFENKVYEFLADKAEKVTTFLEAISTQIVAVKSNAHAGDVAYLRDKLREAQAARDGETVKILQAKLQNMGAQIVAPAGSGEETPMTKLERLLGQALAAGDSDSAAILEKKIQALAVGGDPDSVTPESVGVSSQPPKPRDPDSKPHKTVDEPQTPESIPPASEDEDSGEGEEGAGGGNNEPSVKVKASKGAVKLAAEAGINLEEAEIKGTGAGGQITQPDVEKYLKEISGTQE